MTEVHYQETALVHLALDNVTQHLVENLHLRWGYGLLYVDRYMGEDDMPVNVVYGLRKDSDERHFGLRIVLMAESKSTAVETNIRHITMSGWPLQNKEGKGLFRSNPTVGLQKEFDHIADDILEFCEKPHGQSSGVLDTVRSWLGMGGQRRKYKP